MQINKQEEQRRVKNYKIQGNEMERELSEWGVNRGVTETELYKELEICASIIMPGYCMDHSLCGRAQFGIENEICC